MSYGHTPGGEQDPPGWGAGQQASPAYGQPGYGQAPPPTYRGLGITAAICGVLFNLILGFPTALIGQRYGRKVTELWAGGDGPGAVSASRKARAWLIVSVVLDVIGIVLSVVLIAQGSYSTH